MADIEKTALTDQERYALWAAGDHHPDLCDCGGDDWSAEGQWCGGLEDTFAAVERIIGARVATAKADGIRLGIEYVESLQADYANGGHTLNADGALHALNAALSSLTPEQPADD